jgi:hypothetical protein
MVCGTRQPRAGLIPDAGPDLLAAGISASGSVQAGCRAAGRTGMLQAAAQAVTRA